MQHRLVSIEDAQILAKYYALNKGHLQHWEPERDVIFYTEAFWAQRLKQWEAQRDSGEAVHFLSSSGDDTAVVAVCSLTNITRGCFQACNIGYSVSESAQGTGAMKSLLNFVINYAFNELGLNRVMANYMPRNTRSERLLSNLGFNREGIAERYLCINGVWEDHVLTSLLNPKNR